MSECIQFDLDMAVFANLFRKACQASKAWSEWADLQSIDDEWPSDGGLLPARQAAEHAFKDIELKMDMKYPSWGEERQKIINAISLEVWGE